MVEKVYIFDEEKVTSELFEIIEALTMAIPCFLFSVPDDMGMGFKVRVEDVATLERKLAMFV